MIFQQPTSSLNPVWTSARQIGEVLEIHRGMKRQGAREARALELLKMVGIPDPERRLKAFPHEMSGGMAQRVMIAMALACEPELLIADEPTTALDVTIQAQILDLMRDLRDETGTAIILITHDLGVVAEMCDRVAVMYAGEIVEQTDVATLFREPRHPYTQGLIGSIPVVGDVRDELAVIPGNVPNLIDLPDGLPLRAALRGSAASSRTNVDPGAADVAHAAGSPRPSPSAGPRRSAAGSTTASTPGRRCPTADRPDTVPTDAIAAADTLRRARADRPIRATDATTIRARTSRSRSRRERRRPCAPLVEVRDLVKHFPIRGGVLQRTVGRVQAVDGVELHDPARRDARASSASRAAARRRSGGCCCG